MCFGHADKVVVDIEPAPVQGHFTILLVGDSTRHQHIAAALANVPGVVVVHQSIGAEFQGREFTAVIRDELPTAIAPWPEGWCEQTRHYTDREPGSRTGKGERKRNKALRWA